jgi:hypothetical protein
MHEPGCRTDPGCLKQAQGEASAVFCSVGHGREQAGGVLRCSALLRCAPAHMSSASPVMHVGNRMVHDADAGIIIAILASDSTGQAVSQCAWCVACTIIFG